MSAPFVAVPGQSFASKKEWIARAPRLTWHPKYHNTEHDGPSKGWRGEHFTALCFDQKGRRVRNGGDFQRAEDDGAFPVWWIWPDQIAGLLMTRNQSDAARLAAADALAEAVGEWADCECEADADRVMHDLVAALAAYRATAPASPTSEGDET